MKKTTASIRMKCLFVSFLFSLTTGSILFGQIDLTATGGTLSQSYTTLQAAFAAINAGTHTGTLSIDVSGNTTETGICVLNYSGNGAASYTSLSIQPTGGAARIISGAIAGGSPMIDLSGADNVTIDGLNTGGNSLTIANTTISATSGTSTIRFIGGATNNIITNCNIQGSGTMAVGTNGAVIFFSTDANTANGNDNNTISNNNIGPAGANLPTKAILGNGSQTTTAIGNSGIIITNNDIHDIFGAAVTSSAIATNGGCNTWTITNNRIYQTGTRTWTTGAIHRAIDIGPASATHGAQGFTITGNTIGYASNTQTGTYTLTGSTGKFQGIVFNGITGATVSTISNNTIASVSLTGVTSSGAGTTSPFIGILLTNGLVNSNNNIVGSQSATGSLIYSTTTTTATDAYGIVNLSVDDWTATGNNVGGISFTNLAASGTMLLYGMRAATNPAGKTNTLSSNNIGGTIANSIQLTSTGAASQLIGIGMMSAAASALTSNIIRNLANNNGTGTITAASVIGILESSTTSNHTLSQNTISNLSNTHATAATVITGIQMTGSTANIVERNFIHSLTSSTTSATAEINGIRVAGGTTTFRNNMIAIGAGVGNSIGGAATNTSTAGINGINEVLGTNSFFNNSVYIGGSPTAGTGASYAFNGTQITVTRSFRNNIFYNGRSNSGATGKHYNIKINGTAANPAGLTINNNLYFGNGTGNVFGFFNSLDVANLAAWQTAVGQDALSYHSDPQYVNPTAATPDLHINTGVLSYAEQTTVDLGVSNDYDGDTRSSTSPSDMGADAMNGIAPCISSASLTPGGTTLFCSTAANVTLTAACTANCGTVQNYSWSPATGLSGTSGAVVTATPTVTTTYTLTTTSDAGCVAGFTTVTVTVAETPIITSLSASPSSICSPATSNLSASVATTSSYAVSSITHALIATPGAGVTTLANTGVDVTTLSIGTLDDGQWNNQNLPFTFTSFGVSYTQFTVSTNGVIYLGSGAANSNQGYGLAFPNATTSVRPSIAAMYGDMTFGTNGVIEYFTSGIAPNRKFVINFTNGDYVAGGTMDVQLILYESTQVIEMHTNSSAGTDFAVQGLQNSTGTSAFTVTGRNAAAWFVGTPDAYRFTPNGGSFSYSWSPTTGLSDPNIANPVVSGLTSNETYTLTATDATGCTINGNTTITANNAVADSPSNVSACDSYTLPALTNGNYFTGAGGTGTAMSAGNNITTTQTLFVYVSNACGTDDNSFDVTINTTPTADAPSAVTACDSYTLPALTAGNHYWTGTGATGTEKFATEVISASTTLFIYKETGTTPNCTDENSLGITIYECSELAPAWCSATIAGITNTLNYTAVTGATDYEILVEGPSSYSQSHVRGSSSTNFKLSWFTGILYNTTYSVKVKAKVGGVWRIYGDACNLSTPVVPGNTKLIPSDCGITLGTLDEVLEYNEIYGATDYEIWVQGPSSYSSTMFRNNNSTTFRLSWFTGIKLGGVTYTVKVRSYVNGSWSGYGLACNITTPPIPTTELIPSDCGITLSTFDEILEYNPIPGASDYEMWVEGPSSYSSTMLRNTNRTTFRLSWFSGLTINTTYSVKVRSYVNGIWSAYGSPCNVTTAGTLSMGITNQSDEVYMGSGLMTGGSDILLETYPNPNDGNFTISSNYEGSFNVINELGQIIKSVDITKENNYQTKVEGLERGVYFVTGTLNNMVVTRKIIIQ